MCHLVLQFHAGSTADACSLCGESTPQRVGLRLVTAENLAVVCRNCGKKHASSLTALLDLAFTAERIGRISRYSLAPPMTALLDLAVAAEDYSHKVPARCKGAA